MEDATNNQEDQLFSDQVAKKEKLKIAAKQESSSVWSGLGMFGMVGWSVAVPALSGTALGIWLDEKWHQSFSWTLTFLFLGLISGCGIAWHWINEEDKHHHQNKKNDE